MSLRFWMYVLFMPLGLVAPLIHNLDDPLIRVVVYLGLNVISIGAIELLSYVHRRIVSRTSERAAQLASQQANPLAPGGTTDDLLAQFQS
jgi:hypothetical protein